MSNHLYEIKESQKKGWEKKERCGLPIRPILFMLDHTAPGFV